MRFTKMHGAGNDYVYVNALVETVVNPSQLAQEISDRHFGVGGDGLILILPSEMADLHMRIFNADGSEAEMCGNGIRCVAKYAYDHGLINRKRMTVETASGIMALEMFTGDSGRVDRVRVNMGPPRLLRSVLPVSGPPDGTFVEQDITILDRTFQATCVSMGNPHCVIYIPKLDDFPVEKYGPLIECHPMFPKRINVEFVEVLNKDEVRQRTWERGAGETLACGTGSAAVTVAGVLTGRTRKILRNHLAGGVLEMEWLEEKDVFMTGPAVEVFTGTYQPR